MNRLFFVTLSIACMLLSVKAAALEVNDLYRVVVDVDDQSSQQRNQAVTKALRGVFLKVGGKKSVLEHKLLQRALKQPNNYITQYHYQRQEDALSLTVKFDENKVNALFKQATLPIWGSLRPQVLLWLIDEQGASRHIVAYDENTSIPDTVTQFSKQRGLPIVMPLMDLTDSEQVILSDLWAYFPDKVQQVSERYYADTVIVMRVSDSSLVEEANETLTSEFNDANCGILCDDNKTSPKALDWKVYTQNTLYIQRYKGDDKLQLINQGLSDITELIYQNYALSTSTETDFFIEVKNVNSLKSDMELFNFLQDLSGVNSVTLINAQADMRRFKLDLNSNQATFLASLRLNNKLTQVLDTVQHEFDSEEHDSEDVFSGQDYLQMKVIVLGEEAALLDDEQQPLNSTSINTGKERGEIFDQANQALPSKSNDTVLDITPIIPVFYWEKG